MNREDINLIISKLGKALKNAREDKKMTREVLAEIVDVAPRHIQAIENEGQAPSINLLFRLVTLFDISIDQYLFPDLCQNHTTLRRQIDTYLDDFDNSELLVIEGTVKGICRAKDEFAKNI